MSGSLRIMAYDATERSPVGWSWAIGAKVFGPWFDAVIPATSWPDLLERCVSIAVQRDQSIRELQIWGHGRPGEPLMRGAPLVPRHHAHLGALQAFARVLARPALVWFRMCGVFCGKPGQEYGEALADLLDCDVAAHTYVIGFPWHSGLHTVHPRKEATWSIHEGRGVDGHPLPSGRCEPNTQLFCRMSYPPEW